MFDEIKCKYPLGVEGFEDHVFQTKDTPAQYMEMYEIREDGTLWHETYDVEDHSEAGKFEREHPGQKADVSLFSIAGMCARVNKQWEPCNMTGEIAFYSLLGDNPDKRGWVEFSSYFLKGKLQQLHLIEYKPSPKP